MKLYEKSCVLTSDRQAVRRFFWSSTLVGDNRMLTKYCNTKRAGWLALSFILSVGVILTTLPAAYAVPMMTNYQGTLKDSKGKVLKDSVVTLTFAVYEVPAGGTALWTETHSGVSVKEGAFSVVLGSVVSIPESVAQGERYLGVTVNTDAEMTPRQALVSGFFAMRAGVAESVVSGSVTSDKLGAASVTSEKVADSAVTTTKLAPTAVTGDKLAVDSVTTDKIANGAVTTEKLSTEVQEKLAQGSSMPATVTTLNVTEKLKVGTNSLYLGSSTSVPGSTNEIYTDGGNLLLQSNAGNTNNTVISANADNTGKVGIGTNTPTSKLSLEGDLLIYSPVVTPLTTKPGMQFYFDGGTKPKTGIASVKSIDASGTAFVPFALETSDLELTAAISSSEKGIVSTFAPIKLTGSPITLNDGSLGKPLKNVSIGTEENLNMLDVNGGVTIGSFLIPKVPADCIGSKYYAPLVDCRPIAPQDGLFVKGIVGIGTKTPQNKLDVAGSVAIGSGYAGTNTVPENGLLVEGSVGIGTTSISPGALPYPAKLDINGDVHTSGNLLIGKQGYRWIFHHQNWVPEPDALIIAPENPSANQEGWDWNKSLVLWKNGNIRISGNIISDGDICIGKCN